MYDDPDGSGDLPHFTSLLQVETEEFMLAACREAGIDVHWDSEVVEVETNPDGVRLETADGDVWVSSYVIGADSAGSAVRKAIGAEFEGDRSRNSFVIVDVDEHPENPRPTERVFHYDHPDVGGRNVLFVSFSGEWRVDLQCKESDDPDRLSDDEVVREWLSAVLRERYVDRISWVSTYQFLQMTADAFIDEHRRALLAGEAAHLFAPFGARGMNSGVADADAAASAVVVALRARTDGIARAEVEAYAAEREKAAEWNRTAAGQALEHLQGDGLAINLKKRAAARLAEFWESAGEWLDEAPYGPRSGPPVPTSRKY